MRTQRQRKVQVFQRRVEVLASQSVQTLPVGHVGRQRRVCDLLDLLEQHGEFLW